jgi:Bax protein
MKELKLGMFFIYLFLQVVNITSAKYMNNINKRSDGFVRKTFIEKSVSEYKVIYVSNSDDLKEKIDYNYVYSLKGMDLNEYSTEEKKEFFLKLMMPAIKVSSEEILAKKELVQKLAVAKKIGTRENKILEKLFADYKVKGRNFEKLLDRMIVPPASIILGQAILESGWGTSRFFKEGNNVFGVWSYNSKEARMKAGESREDGFTAYLKKYDDLKGAVDNYILLLSTGSAYKEFRKGINRGESPEILVKYMVKYSELGEVYTERLGSVMRVNELDKYDI